MSPGGPFWVPPPLPTVSSDSEEEREKEQQKERERRRKEAREREAAAEKEGAAKDDKYKYTTGKTQCMCRRQKEKALAAEREKGGGGGRLSEADAAEFTALLSQLTVPRRHLIREAMGFALDKSDASSHIVELLTASLIADSSFATAAATASAIDQSAEPDKQQQLPPPPVMVARLYLVSDILHNSSAPVRNSSSYRTLLQSALPRIFEALGAALRGVSGRMTARQLQDR
eukprot:20213-Heterococcus_DN1.PRE.1